MPLVFALPSGRACFMLSALPLENLPGESASTSTPLNENAGEANDADVALMLEVGKGNTEAFEILVRRYQKSLLNFFIRMGAYTDSEDLVQDTFVRLYRYRERYQPTAKFTTFLYVLARRVWADLGRKSQRRERLTARLQTEADIAGQTEFVSSMSPVDVEAALDKLSAKLRDVIVLNIFQGLRYQEIADVLDIPLGTVKSRINLAIAALREIFLKDENNASIHPQ